MLFEDSLFVYPLGNDFDKLHGTQSVKIQFWNTNDIFHSLDFTNYFKRIFFVWNNQLRTFVTGNTSYCCLLIFADFED